VTSGAVGEKCSRWTALLAVSESAPSVRPWNPPTNARNLGRRVAYRASFMAASIDSAPELVKNTFFLNLPGVISARRPARSDCNE
jgi:hypothetical protein